MKLKKLNNKNVIVTGGAGDGYADQITDILCKLGANLIITSRSNSKLKKRLSFLKKKYTNKVFGYNVILDKEKNIKDFVNKIQKKFNKIDVLINNASGNVLKSVEKVSVKEWDHIIRINLTANFILSREISKIMKKYKYGKIINISSIYGVVSPNHEIYGKSKLNSPLIYGLTKSGIIYMTKYLATYFAKYKINVNCISPGGLFNKQEKNFVKKYINLTPLRRMANSKDIQGAIELLSSHQSDYITGQNIIVDGGWTLH